MLVPELTTPSHEHDNGALEYSLYLSKQQLQDDAAVRAFWRRCEDESALRARPMVDNQD